MSTKNIFSRFKSVDLKTFVSIFFPYLLALSVIIFFLSVKAEDVALFSALALLVSIILRVSIISLKKHATKQSIDIISDWEELRKQLTLVLSKSKILLDTAIELKSDEASNIILSEEQINGNFFEENEELIKTIRKIGIDGILCLLFLLQQEPAVVSVRALQKSLKIPVASIYRHMKKITEINLVITYYNPEKPIKSLYKITDEGSSLLIQLYELLGGSMFSQFNIVKKNSKIPAEVT